VEGVDRPEPVDIDFGIDAGGEIVARPGDTDFGQRPVVWVRGLTETADHPAFSC